MAKIVIFGTSEFSVLTQYRFAEDSPYQPVAFTVNREFMKEETLGGLPVVPFEDVETVYPPGEYKMFVAVLFSRVNRTRAEKCAEAKLKGYELVSYVSPKAATWPGMSVGENCFIGQGSFIEPFSEIGNDVYITGSFVSHHAVVRDHCFLATNSVLLGGVTVEPYSFVGANATIGHGIVIARECIIGAGVAITRNTQERGVYVNKRPDLLPIPSNEFWAEIGSGRTR